MRDRTMALMHPEPKIIRIMRTVTAMVCCIKTLFSSSTIGSPTRKHQCGDLI